MTYRIPFNRPSLVGRELDYLAQSIALGHTSGNGAFTRRAEALLESTFGAQRILLTASCTAALEMAALLCGLGPADEVIMPSYTFVSTANAVALRGARPVFVDIRSDTLNIDERLIEAAITPRTRAIFVVHYGGVGCEMGAIIAIARRHGLIVVEDAAQGVFARHERRWLGTIGDLGCYSFHETKNFSCGEGGALVVNDPALIERAEILRDKGTNRSQFFRGEVEKYTWVDLGSSYVLSDMLAAFLFGQIEHMKDIVERRGRITELYRRRLHVLVQLGQVRMPCPSPNSEGNHHLFYLITANADERSALIAHLHDAGIMAVFHYVPLHSAPFTARLADARPDLPVTDSISARIVRLPLYLGLRDQDIIDVTDSILGFYRARAAAA